MSEDINIFARFPRPPRGCQKYKSFVIHPYYAYLKNMKANATCVFILQVEILVRDTHQTAVSARKVVLELHKQGVVGLIGSSTSNPTIEMATIAGIKPVNLAVVGFRAASEDLKYIEKYPTFLRVNPSISFEVRAIVDLMAGTFCMFEPALCCYRCIHNPLLQLAS